VFASLFVTLYQLKVISQSIWLQLTAATRNVSVTSVTTLLLGYVAVANNEFVLRDAIHCAYYAVERCLSVRLSV